MLANDSLFLIFVAPPEITVGSPGPDPVNGTVPVGTFACTDSILECEVTISTGTPVNITWEIDGMQEDFVSDDNISNIMADMPGTYTCTVTNHFGTVNESSEVVSNAMSICTCMYLCVHLIILNETAIM